MNNKALLIAWVASIIATLGSLYFSEYLGFIPCTLCWYQRILMYPLVIILGIAFYRGDNRIWLYVLPISLLGVALASYHYFMQKSPSLIEFAACQVGVPCSGEYINWLGFITIPFLSLLGFIIISVSMLVAYKHTKRNEENIDE